MPDTENFPIMDMDLELLRQMLEIDSTSGRERTLAEWLETRLATDGPAPRVERFEVGDGTLNLLFSWGTPQVVFCSHLDTVPPYIPPVFDGVAKTLTEAGDVVIRGRGACDAKGQIFSMYTACRQLAAEGHTGFGLLLLAGEETGSFGARAFARTGFRAPYLIVGEPTENQMVSASKGTQSYDLVFTGRAFHSGYPEQGVSAIDRFVDFMNRLRAADFGIDPELGPTTWNVGLLHSDNPQNILAPRLSCRLYFRTTFASDSLVQQWMAETPDYVEVTPRGGDTPARYLTLDGFPAGPVAFGSDAPHLTNFIHKAICGPGSITTAHRDNEQVRRSELEQAVKQYIAMFHQLQHCSAAPATPSGDREDALLQNTDI